MVLISEKLSRFEPLQLLAAFLHNSTLNGIVGARVHEAIIIIPMQSGEIHRRIQGVVTKAKLDAIIEEYKATDHA